jgi:hypothetical protein
VLWIVRRKGVALGRVEVSKVRLGGEGCGRGARWRWEVP